MTRLNKRFVAAAMVCISASIPANTSVALAQGLITPPDWRWRLDRPATLVTGDNVPDSAWRFVGMPPGWHITTGPGVVLFHPQERAVGRYSLSSNQVLFPDPDASGLGMVFGCADIANAKAACRSVQIRRDSAVRIVRSEGGNDVELAPWQTHAVITPNHWKDVVTNRLRVAVAPDSLRVFVNDSAVVVVAAAGLHTDGRFGLFIGEKRNMHIMPLDLTRHLAPVPGAR